MTSIDITSYGREDGTSSLHEDMHGYQSSKYSDHESSQQQQSPTLYISPMIASAASGNGNTRLQMQSQTPQSALNQTTNMGESGRKASDMGSTRPTDISKKTARSTGFSRQPNPQNYFPFNETAQASERIDDTLNLIGCAGCDDIPLSKSQPTGTFGIRMNTCMKNLQSEYEVLQEQRNSLVLEIEELRRMCSDRNQLYDSAKRLSLEVQHLRSENAELRDRELQHKSVCPDGTVKC